MSRTETKKPFELDKIIHQPVRTKIIAFLVNVGACDFVDMKKALDLTDGHMSTHMKELVSNGYVEVEKSFVDNKPRTTYKITKEGKKKFLAYVENLKSLIAMK